MSKIMQISQSQISSQELIWNDERQDKLIKELLVLLSKNLKENQWYNYQVCFKKTNKGEILIRNPESKEII